MTIREFAKLNNFPIKGKLTRIPDEVEYDFNDRPHNCKRYVDEDFNEYSSPMNVLLSLYRFIVVFCLVL